MLRTLSEELAELSKKEAAKKLHVSEPESSGYIRLRGKRVLDLTSWDLLGVSENPEFKKAIFKECEVSKLGFSRARLLSGNFRAHSDFEVRLSKFLHSEGTLLFSSKNQAVLTLITSIFSERDALFVDELIQSPVVDAAYLVNSQVFQVSTSQGTLNLEKELEKAKGSFNRYIFVEALSPITGKLIDIDYYLHLAERFDAYLLIDESYSLGIIGQRGAGILEGKAPFPARVLCSYGSLGGCVASYGAFISGSRILVEYLINRSRTFLAENSLPPLVLEGASRAIDIIETSVSSRAKLNSVGQTLSNGLSQEGLLLDQGASHPVICLLPLRPRAAVELSEGFFERGFLVEALPFGQARNDHWTVRILVSTYVTEKSAESFLEASSDLAKKLRKRSIQLT